MSLDPYQPCPACVGTNKKVKFCCAAITGAMEKISKLQESQQSARAIEELRKLHEAHPGNAWVATSLAAELMDNAEVGESRTLLHGVLKETPDHPFALALLATLAFAVEGYEDAKPIIHRALQKAAPIHPAMLARIVVGIASDHMEHGCYLAARENLALALRLVRNDEDRREVFETLYRFEGDGSIPYPLRSVHQLARYEGTEEENTQQLLAMKLSYLGLWAEAAGVLQKLVDAHPDEAALHQNLGFCRAWDGDQAAAIPALRRASTLQQDYATAVELETIAQLLELEDPSAQLNVTSEGFEVPPVARLLSELEESPRIVRRELDPDERESGLAGRFFVLDVEVPTETPTADTSPEDIPNIIGEIFLYPSHAETDRPPQAVIGGFEGPELEATREVFSAILGDRAKPFELPGDRTTASVPVEWQSLSWRAYFSKETPLAVRRELDRRRWKTIVEDSFGSMTFAALGGRTPEQAKGDPDHRIALAALIAIFDAQCNRSDYELDVPSLLERFDVEAPPPFALDDQTPLSALSSMQLVRVPIDQLADDRLTELVNRAMLIRHNGFLRRLLVELLQRPGCRESVDLDLCHQTLAELERNHHAMDEAIAWIERGREAALAGSDDFETNLRWRMLELRFRLEHPNDPGLAPLLDQMWNYFGRKIPKLREYLHTAVVAAGIEPPWTAADLLSGDATPVGATTPGGLWTPGTEVPAAEGGEQKLWVPGS